MENRKANLFIVGAMKAGTTSFMKLLEAQREVYVSPIKEPHYFINTLPKNLYQPPRFFNLDSYMENTFPESLHIAKVEKATHYSKLFSLVKDEKYLAEGSTAYFHAPETPFLIHAYNPTSKIIILTRDPLKRTVSHYRMARSLLRDTRSFEKAIQEEIALYRNGQLPWNSYLGMSFYKSKIATFKRYFENVLVLSFEALSENREATLMELYQFLGIPKAEDTEIKHTNKSRDIRFQKLFYFIEKIGVKDYFSHIFGGRIKRSLYKIVSTSKKEPIKLSPAIQEEVEKIFRKENDHVVA